MNIPQFHTTTHYDDEDFCIKIEGKNHKTGEIEQRVIYLTEEEWNKTRKYQWYITDEPVWSDPESKRNATEEEKQNVVESAPADQRFDYKKEF